MIDYRCKGRKLFYYPEIIFIFADTIHIAMETVQATGVEYDNGQPKAFRRSLMMNW
jgi:hypothetical protein